MNNLILIGFKSAGKTTLGRLAAAKFQRPFIDVDDLFEVTPHIFYQTAGAEAFRAEEKKLLRTLEPLKGHVIATGGGVILDSENREFLRKIGCVIHLHTPKEIIKQRIFSSQLPAFLDGSAQFETVYYNRLGIYTAIAHHSIITEDELWEVIRLDPFSE